MAASKTTSSVVLSRYASSLADLAEKSEVIGDVKKDLKVLEGILADVPDLVRALSSPAIGKSQKMGVVQDVSAKGGFHKLTANFLNVLVQNGRISSLQGIIEQFYAEVSRRRGEVTVVVDTAIEMTGKQQDALREQISSALGHGIVMRARVKPEIMGGMVVTVGSYMVDNSVRRKLERLGAVLLQGSNNKTVQHLKEVG